MSEFNSTEEDRLIWTRTKDEIVKRWSLFSKWGTVSRIASMFGDSDSEENKRIPLPDEENDVKVFDKLNALFGS